MNQLVPVQNLPLEPASIDQAAGQVSRMFGMLLSPKKEGFSEAIAKEYLDAIQHQPLWAIEAAATKFIQGSYEWVPDRDRKFVPVVSDFAEAVRGEAAFERRKRKDQEQLAAQQLANEEFAKVRASKTPEAKQRVQEQMNAWKASYQEHQAEILQQAKPEKSIFEITNERQRGPYGELAKIAMDRRGQ